MTHPRNQDGFALIEVIVSAAVLAIIALAVLSGIDGATASTARERARAVAASLAEKDQERLRGYRFDELANVRQQEPVEVGGVKYVVKSEATWVVDKGTVASTCAASGTQQTEYMRIVSTVTSDMVGARIPPVKVESLVAAPVSGSLVVKVEPGDPTKPARVARVAGLAVQITSTIDGRTFSNQTNPQGCAIFRGVEPGDYTVRLNTPGYVDRKGQQASEATATVGAGIVNTLTMAYDKSVSFSIDIKTLKPGATYAAANVLATKVPSVSTENSDDKDVVKTFTPSAATSNVRADGLFPFKSGYTFYAGSCGTENPVAVATANKDFFSDVNYKFAAVAGDPNAFQPQSVTAFEPAFNIRVRNDSTGAAASGRVVARVWLKDVNGDACPDFQGKDLPTMAWPSGLGTVPSGAGASSGFVSSSSTEFDPGMPFGTYTVCLRDVNVSPNKWFNAVTTYDNTAPTGRATTLELGNSTSSNWSTTMPSGCRK